MGFSFPENGRQWIEGVIDLVIGTQSGELWIVDWKTNQITSDKIDRLRDHYRRQLAAYWKAVSEISKLQVEAAIYSTAAGALVRYSTDELEEEWSRLEKLPPCHFDVEVAADLRPTSSPPVNQSEQLEFAQL